MMTTLKITFQFGFMHQQENESLTNPILLLLDVCSLEATHHLTVNIIQSGR